MTSAKFGIGAYSLTEAGMLLNVPPRTLRRWVFGYQYVQEDQNSKMQLPLWKPQYGANHEVPLLGFRDLIEARIVNGLKKSGIGLPTIRDCLRIASEIVDDDHPFSNKRFKTDGKKLFLEIFDDMGEGKVIDLKQRQHAFQKIVAPSFIDLEFDADVASRWWLLPNKKTIVADPARAFGQPIIAETGVTTRRIAQAVEAEGSVERVASIFEISKSSVKDALTIEGWERKKLAA